MIGIVCKHCGKRNSFLVNTGRGIQRRKYCEYCGRQLFPVKRVSVDGSPYNIRYEPAVNNINYDFMLKKKNFDEILEEVCDKNEPVE